MPPTWKPRSALGVSRFRTTTEKFWYWICVERQVDAGQQERALIPARAAVDAQLDLPARFALAERVGARLADRDDLAARVDDEVGLARAVDRALHRRQTVQPQRQLEIGRLHRECACRA